MIYLLTATGLSPSGSTRLHTNNTLLEQCPKTGLFVVKQLKLHKFLGQSKRQQQLLPKQLPENAILYAEIHNKLHN